MKDAERNDLVLGMPARVLRQHAKSGRVACPPVSPDRLDWAIRIVEQFGPASPEPTAATTRAQPETAHG